MPQDAPPNGSARDGGPQGSWSRVAGMQAKLHRWAAADPGRRFDDLFNFVHDPATLIVAFARVAGNQGANTPGVDGLTAAYVEESVGVPGFLEDLRAGRDDKPALELLAGDPGALISSGRVPPGCWAPGHQNTGRMRHRSTTSL
jgi:hypothetical protein